ncbi:MAG TPA: site-specific integrase [Acetobacteraceae bacterium]|nr:site-specific integrase [Acetobacteraceae bacterium]
MAPFLASLAHDDLAPATLRGYRYDLRHFLAWHRTVQDRPFTLEGLAEYELIAYRQHMVAAGRRPASVNRRLDALRRLCRWARGTGALAADAAHDVRPMRTIRNGQPVGLTEIEVHALLRAAGASSHGLAARNYAMVQLMLQAGLRVREVAALAVADITMNDRSGSVRIRRCAFAAISASAASTARPLPICGNGCAKAPSKAARPPNSCCAPKTSCVSGGSRCRP